MITCTRRLTFCAGHRVHGHEGKCRNLHGHNYVVEVEAAADRLDGIGRVIDFSVLKERVGGWVEREWDHGFIAWSGDAEAIAALALVAGQRVFLLPTNPTAENLAAYLLDVVCPDVLAGTGVRVVRVRVGETENCSATAESAT